MAADAAGAAKKYLEYKQKLQDWEELFEGNNGHIATDADRRASETYAAIAAKAEHYKRLMSDMKGGGSEHHSHGHHRSHHHRHHHHHSSDHDERSLDERLHSSSHKHGSRQRKHGKHGKHGHHGSGSAHEDSSPQGASQDRRASSQISSVTSTTLANDDVDNTHGGSSLPALPHAVGTLSGNAEWAVALAQATEALNKCRKWERAFERQQGEAPTAQVKAASSTYGSFERRYLIACNQMERLVAHETAKVANFDDSLGVRGVAIQSLASGGGATASDETIKNRRRSAVMANDESMARMAKPIPSRGAVSSESASADSGQAQPQGAAAPKEASVHGFLIEACKKVTLFSSLKEKEIEAVVGSMVCRPASANEVIIKQGDHGDHCYVVEAGTYDVFLASVGKGHQSVKTYNVGDAFGELALMYNTPRAATVRCTEAGTLWELSRAAYRAILITDNQTHDATANDFLRRVPVFEGLTNDQLSRLSSACETETFDVPQRVVCQGDPAEHIYFLMKGSAYAQKRGSSEKFTIGPKMCFGESALATNAGEDARTRKADVFAEAGCTMLKLSVDDFYDLVGHSLDVIVSRNFNTKLISTVKIAGQTLTSLLPRGDMDKLVSALEEVTFEKGEPVIEEGETGDTFYIVKAGEAVVSTKQRGDIVTLGDGDFFGEMALINDDPRAATVTAKSTLTCLALQRSTFTKLFGPLQERLELTAGARREELDQTKFEDLLVIKAVGSGSFGHVNLVVHQPTNLPYALKCMLKSRVVGLNQVEHVFAERSILRMCEHPFICSLAATFQDSDYIYMLLEYVPGGELFSVLQSTVCLIEPVAAFYAACVTAAFEHLHDRNIAYRDLKPENLLIDAQGYIKLVDFGFAKVVQSKTWTLCGTPEYLAPEIVMNKGHNSHVDWWALGILTHEMLMGEPPFQDDNDPMVVYQQILAAVIPEPKRGKPPLSKPARHFIERLCTKETAQRLGCMKHGVEDVRSHAFLSKINWRRLQRKLLQPPYIPQLSGPLDTSSFASNIVPDTNFSAAHLDHAELETTFKEW